MKRSLLSIALLVEPGSVTDHAEDVLTIQTIDEKEAVGQDSEAITDSPREDNPVATSPPLTVGEKKTFNPVQHENVIHVETNQQGAEGQLATLVLFVVVVITLLWIGLGFYFYRASEKKIEELEKRLEERANQRQPAFPDILKRFSHFTAQDADDLIGEVTALREKAVALAQSLETGTRADVANQWSHLVDHVNDSLLSDTVDIRYSWFQCYRLPSGLNPTYARRTSETDNKLADAFDLLDMQSKRLLDDPDALTNILRFVTILDSVLPEQ